MTLFNTPTQPSFNWNDGTLVAYYRMNETSGTSTYDAFNNYNGGIIGSGYILGQPGIINTAYNFTGTNSYVNITTIPITTFGTGNFTMSAWVRTNTSNVINQQFIGQSSTAGLTPYFGFTLRDSNFQNNNPSGAVSFHMNDPSASPTDADAISTVPINDNNWHFLVGEKISNTTGNFVTLYLDGNLIDTMQINGNTNESLLNNVFAIGGNAGSSVGPNFFYGTINNVGIWNRSLSSDEILQLYNNGEGLSFNGTTYSPPLENITTFENVNVTNNLTAFNAFFTNLETSFLSAINASFTSLDVINLVVDTNALVVNNHQVGINTATPQNALNVLGDINFTGNIYGNGNQLTNLSMINSSYYLASNPSGYVNWSQVTNGSVGGGLTWAQATNGTLAQNNSNTLYANTLFSGNNNLSIGYKYATNGTYYLASNPSGYVNWSQALNGTLALTSLLSNYYLNSNPSNFYNNVTLKNLSQLNDNLGNRGYTNLFNFTNGPEYINWSQTTNGTLMLQANWNATNTSYYLNSNPFGFYNLTTIPNYALNSSLNNYYLASNPSNFYNSTTLKNVSQLFNNNGYYNATNPPPASEPNWNGNASNVAYVNKANNLNGSVNVTTGNISLGGNLGGLIYLPRITLPSCASATNGSIGRNSSGLYFCNATRWVKIA